MKRKIIIAIVFIILGFISFYGLDGIFGLKYKEQILKYNITCKKNTYLVDEKDWDIRYEGYAKKVLIVNYNNQVINCGADYFVDEVYITKEKE